MKYLLTLPLLLVACASQPTIKVETQKVEVPIAIACKTPTPPAPNYCFSSLKQQDDIFVKARCLLSDRLQSLGYEAQLSTVLESCQ